MKTLGAAHLVYLLKKKPEGYRVIDPAKDILDPLITERETSIIERDLGSREQINGGDDPVKMCPIYKVECPSDHVSRNVNIDKVIEKEERER